MNRPKRGSGTRSNLYSDSKFSNWSSFNPYRSEFESIRPSMRPVARFEAAGLSNRISLLVRKPHPEFLRPCDVDDVLPILAALPVKFLEGLDRICLLGGTNKQLRSARSDAFHYGSCVDGDIYLTAFPRELLKMPLRGPLKPSIEQEYTRVGAQVVAEREDPHIQFDLESLRRFYLYDVLLHEIGHHVDRDSDRGPGEASERFAKWFAVERLRLLADDVRAPGG
jgi:hypothetical protein